MYYRTSSLVKGKLLNFHIVDPKKRQEREDVQEESRDFGHNGGAPDRFFQNANGG